MPFGWNEYIFWAERLKSFEFQVILHCFEVFPRAKNDLAADAYLKHTEIAQTDSLPFSKTFCRHFGERRLSVGRTCGAAPFLFTE
jgi:hypothetical protein